MVWYRIKSPLPGTTHAPLKNQPPLTISILSFDSLIQLYSVQSFPKTSISCNSSSQVQSRFTSLHPQGFIQPYVVFHLWVLW